MMNVAPCVHAVDVASDEQVQGLIADTENEYGGVDVIVYDASDDPGYAVLTPFDKR